MFPGIHLSVNRRPCTSLQRNSLICHKKSPQESLLEGFCTIGWCRWPESNWRPSHYECAALPTELQRKRKQNRYLRQNSLELDRTPDRKGCSVFIRLRGNRWQARVAIKGYPEQVKSFNSEADALAWGTQVEKQIAEGGYTEPDRTTLQGALARYRTDVTPTKKGGTKELSILKRLSAHRIASLPLMKVRGADVAAYRDEMKSQGYAPATITRHLAVLSHIFNTARREWALEVSNPVEMVKKPIVRNARTRRLNAGELDKIISATESVELGAILRIAVETCMRRSELVALRWSDVDFTRRVACLADTKNGEPRTVPLSPTAMQILQSLPRRIDGRVIGMTADSVTKAFERACNRAGVVGLRLHDLRREGVSRLFERGWSIPDVACMSGHKTWSQLARYTSIKAEELAKRLG